MLLITSIKILVLGLTMFPISFGALGTSILFSGYCFSLAKNPEENENLFNSTLMGFALMETFIFLSLIVGFIIYLL